MSLSNGIRAVGLEEGMSWKNRFDRGVEEMHQNHTELLKMMEESLKKMDRILEMEGLLTESERDEAKTPNEENPVVNEGLEVSNSFMMEMHHQNKKMNQSSNMEHEEVNQDSVSPPSMAFPSVLPPRNHSPKQGEVCIFCQKGRCYRVSCRAPLPPLSQPPASPPLPPTSPSLPQQPSARPPLRDDDKPTEQTKKLGTQTEVQRRLKGLTAPSNNVSGEIHLGQLENGPNTKTWAKIGTLGSLQTDRPMDSVKCNNFNLSPSLIKFVMTVSVTMEEKNIINPCSIESTTYPTRTSASSLPIAIVELLLPRGDHRFFTSNGSGTSHFCIKPSDWRIIQDLANFTQVSLPNLRDRAFLREKTTEEHLTPVQGPVHKFTKVCSSNIGLGVAIGCVVALIVPSAKVQFLHSIPQTATVAPSLMFAPTPSLLHINSHLVTSIEFLLNQKQIMHNSFLLLSRNPTQHTGASSSSPLEFGFTFFVQDKETKVKFSETITKEITKSKLLGVLWRNKFLSIQNFDDYVADKDIHNFTVREILNSYFTQKYTSWTLGFGGRCYNTDNPGFEYDYNYSLKGGSLISHISNAVWLYLIDIGEAEVRTKVTHEKQLKKYIEVFQQNPENKEDHTKFHEAFSKNKKFRIPENSNEIERAGLHRHHTTKSVDRLASLKDYVTRMTAEWNDTYCMTGKGKWSVESFRFLVKLKKKESKSSMFDCCHQGVYYILSLDTDVAITTGVTSGVSCGVSFIFVIVLEQEYKRDIFVHSP
ncbi:hypothetical protein LXL04_036374 [Taraxacum kok-saghyz]